MNRQLFPPFGGSEGRKLDRQLLYSRFRPIRTYRCADEQETIENTFYSCAVMPPDDTYILAGTYLGDVKMFNLKTGAEESSYSCHDSQVTHLQVIFLTFRGSIFSEKIYKCQKYSQISKDIQYDQKNV